MFVKVDYYFYNVVYKELICTTKFKTFKKMPNLAFVGSLQRCQKPYYLNAKGEICRNLYRNERVIFTLEQISKFKPKYYEKESN